MQPDERLCISHKRSWSNRRDAAGQISASMKPRQEQRMYRSRALLAALAAAAFVLLAPRVACTPANAAQAAPAAQQDMPEWLRRGLPGPGHAALEPLIGTWHVQFSLYATLGRGV